MPSLVVSGLVKSYGPARALNGAALDLRGGEVHALMGENGAGKSTLIRILAGLERADAGTITLNGVNARIRTPADAQAAGFRFLHQELQVVPGLSVAENMHLSRPYPSRFGLVRWGALAAAAQSALVRLGVAHIDPRLPINGYGPGDQMLVRIAATLLTGDGPEPWLYVMDEPTAALTGIEADRLFAAIAALRRAGAAMLYVSHRIDEVLRISDRVTVLRDGAHVSTRALAETSRDRIIHEMTGRDFSQLYPPRAAPVAVKPLLLVRGLSAGILNNISFDLHAGEVLGVAGLSGSGRNMLLRALMGAVPRQGEVLLEDKSLARSPAACWAQGLAYVPRERRAEGLMLSRALEETIALPHLAGLSGAGFVSRRRSSAMAAHLASAVRLKACNIRQPCAELSGGNQQKVLFARALAGNPRVLLLDEPTRGVDVGAKFDIYAVIRTLAASGVGVIVVSSDLPELIGISDKIAIMHRGRLTGIAQADGLSEAGLLTRCYAEMETI